MRFVFSRPASLCSFLVVVVVVSALAVCSIAFVSGFAFHAVLPFVMLFYFATALARSSFVPFREVV
jgi:hypothetical protein